MTSSIDDLFGSGSGSEPVYEPPPARLTRFGAVIKVTIVSAVLAFCLYWVLTAVSVRIPYLLIFGVFLTLLLGRRLLKSLHPPPVLKVVEPERQVQQSRPFAEAKRWVDRLDYVDREPEQFRRMLQPALGLIADERLRLRHGITRASDPARAAGLLGPALWSFLGATKLARPPGPAELAVLVKQLEEL